VISPTPTSSAVKAAENTENPEPADEGDVQKKFCSN
jgi:hypothetical protein